MGRIMAHKATSFACGTQIETPIVADDTTPVLGNDLIAAITKTRERGLVEIGRVNQQELQERYVSVRTIFGPNLNRSRLE